MCICMFKTKYYELKYNTYLTCISKHFHKIPCLICLRYNFCHFCYVYIKYLIFFIQNLCFSCHNHSYKIDIRYSFQFLWFQAQCRWIYKRFRQMNLLNTTYKYINSNVLTCHIICEFIAWLSSCVDHYYPCGVMIQSSEIG